MASFDEIYQKNLWGFGSGNGSLPSVTKSYRHFLEQFIAENNVTKVVDYGCGDWQFSRLIDWGQAAYTGLDVVEAVVAKNRRQFQTKKITFQTIEPGSTSLPKGDLLIVKDVLQHLSDREVKTFLAKVVPRFKFALITNCIWPAKDVNIPIKSGEFRPLDVRLVPFNAPGAVVHVFSGPRTFVKSSRKFLPAWRKSVVFIQNH